MYAKKQLLHLVLEYTEQHFMEYIWKNGKHCNTLKYSQHRKSEQCNVRTVCIKI